MRFFNTAGPVKPGRHYSIPPLARLDRDAVLRLIGEEKYFVLHAPRQTGKTSALLALRDLLNEEGRVRCVYANFEVGQTAREDVPRALRAVLAQLQQRAEVTLGDRSPGRLWSGLIETTGPDAALNRALTLWSSVSPKPLVLLLDEVDSLVGDALIAVLRQLRAGYDQRPRSFPQSVVLCGVRDVRDYRIQSTTERAVIAGGSAFNIRAKSLRLGNFDRAEVSSLLGQHTAETGQPFAPSALAEVWQSTGGQPWLVNALADQACFEDPRGRDRRQPVTRDAILRAREALILRRDTHLDQLADKLQEPRVRRVIEPLLADSPNLDELADDDLQYARDLGLVALDAPVRIANPIYQEVIPRALTWTTQERLRQETAWYVEDGRLRTGALLEAFQQFFREHSEHWMERFAYREAGPQLLLQAFLQRIVNAGGRIEREYGQGRRRVDLMIVWGRAGEARRRQRVVIECKVLRRGLERTIREGLEQTRAYMDVGGAEEGHLVLFDRRPGRSWKERIFRLRPAQGADPITVWGM